MCHWQKIVFEADLMSRYNQNLMYLIGRASCAVSPPRTGKVTASALVAAWVGFVGEIGLQHIMPATQQCLDGFDGKH